MPVHATLAARGRRLALAVAVLALTGSAPATAATVRMTIDSLAFVPAVVTAHVGDTIEWVNKGFLDHTATSKARGWDVMIPAKKTATLVVKQAGTVDYICRFHPNMKGRLVIEK